jgi:cytidylate kinase
MLAGAPVERVDLNEGHVRAELAEFLARTSKDGGVILGRGGMILLADAPDALHVMLGGERRRRVSRVAEREGISAHQAARSVREHDRARREYIRRAFGVDPDDRALYHLVIDTTALGIDGSLEVVLTAVRTRKQD